MFLFVHILVICSFTRSQFSFSSYVRSVVTIRIETTGVLLITNRRTHLSFFVLDYPLCLVRSVSWSMEERAIRESKGIDVEKRVDRRVEKEETVATLEAHRSLKWPRLIRYSLFPLLGHRYRDCRSVTRTYFPLLHLHRSCSCRMHNESLVFSGTRERGWSPPLATRVFSSFIVSVVATGLPR